MFDNPIFLLLLVLVPLCGWRMWRSASAESIPFSSAVRGLGIRSTWRQRLEWLPAALALAALTLMIFAMARPREGREQTLIHSEGIAIEMVVDRSSSMQAVDFKIDGENVDRLTAIKHVASRFVTGDSESESDDDPLAGRVTDLVGLIAFAGYADAVTPPTLDHAFLVSQLKSTQIVSQRREDGTAIGDAISLAVEKLSSLDKRQKDEIKSKVIILLTDGENTAGEIDPIQAAELAQTLGIRIYSIGVGTRGRAPVPVRVPFSSRPRMQWMQVNIDEPTLKKISATTGGTYFRATDTRSLESIYREIDMLEKTKVETEHFVDYRELAIQSITLAGFRVPPLLLVALLMIAARWILSMTVFRHFGT